MPERTYPLQVCGCNGRLWTRDELGTTCWLCGVVIVQMEATVKDAPERKPKAQETLL